MSSEPNHAFPHTLRSEACLSSRRAASAKRAWSATVRGLAALRQPLTGLRFGAQKESGLKKARRWRNFISDGACANDSPGALGRHAGVGGDARSLGVFSAAANRPPSAAADRHQCKWFAARCFPSDRKLAQPAAVSLKCVCLSARLLLGGENSSRYVPSIPISLVPPPPVTTRLRLSRARSSAYRPFGEKPFFPSRAPAQCRNARSQRRSGIASAVFTFLPSRRWSISSP